MANYRREVLPDPEAPYQCILKEDREPCAFCDPVCDVLQFRLHTEDAVDYPAMAEKVTEQLWEISDIVYVLETWEMAGQRKTA